MARRSIETMHGLPNWPLMLTAAAAAAFLSLTESDFVTAVRHGELPPPREIAGKRLWSRPEIERCLDPASPQPTQSDPIAAAIAAHGARGLRGVTL